MNARPLRPRRGLDWLKPLQVLEVEGDWAEEKPDVRPGGWAFQYRNDHYPDLDDTAVVVMALDRAGVYRMTMPPIARGREWVEGLQCRDGGWGAFDADNSYYYLNNIPFADHGALLDPPTEDVSGRCVGMLAQLGAGDEPRLKAGVDYLLRTQTRGWVLVGPLGRQLHLWHLVGAGGAEWRRAGAGPCHHEEAAPTGWSRSRIRMAAGARIATATSWITRAMSPRRPPRHRPPGRCWA